MSFTDEVHYAGRSVGQLKRDLTAQRNLVRHSEQAGLHLAAMQAREQIDLILDELNRRAA